VINLEHVLPQRPEANWPNFNDDEVKTYSKRIGNLALLRARANSDLRSAGFDEKKKVYRDAPYKLTSAIAKEPGWGPEQISNRQKQLAELAVRAWPLV
jgi:hypothetical protein